MAPLHELGIETIGAAEPAVADVVLVGWDDVLTYAALRAACESIWAGAPLLATSTASRLLGQRRRGARLVGRRRRRHPADDRRARRSRSASRRPSHCARRAARSASSPRRTLVVGDDLELEIAMARRAGARSALVLTGVGTAAAADACPPARRPDAVLADVTALPI